MKRHDTGRWTGIYDIGTIALLGLIVCFSVIEGDHWVTTGGPNLVIRLPPWARRLPAQSP